MEIETSKPADIILVDTDIKTLINESFEQIYVSFTQTFNYIKLLWVKLSEYENKELNTNSNDSQRLKSIKSIKNKVFNKAFNHIIGDVYYDEKHMYDKSKYIHIFTPKENKQLMYILLLLKHRYPDYKWSNIKTYLKPLWNNSRKNSELFGSLFPINIKYIKYNNSLLPLPVKAKTIVELENILVNKINWNNLNEINYEIYNNDLRINILFKRHTQFDTVIYGTFKIYVNESYKNLSKKLVDITKNNTHVNNTHVSKNFVEIVQIETSHNYIQKLQFGTVKINITKDPNVTITQDSLNMTKKYLELLRIVYNINKSFMTI